MILISTQQVDMFFILSPVIILALVLPQNRRSILSVILKLTVSMFTVYSALFTMADYIMTAFMGQTLHLADVFFIDDLLSLIRDNYNVFMALAAASLFLMLPVFFLFLAYRVIGLLQKVFCQFKYKTPAGISLFIVLLLNFTLFMPSSRLWLGIKEALNSTKNREMLAEEFQKESESRQNEIENRIKEAENKTEEQQPRPPLDKLNNSHVFLFIVESYGRTLMVNPSNWKTARPYYEKQYQKLVDAGFSMATQTFQSPAIGGHSWLADSTLNTGLWIETQAAYDELVKTDVPVLNDYFKNRGYRTILAQPGTRESGPEKDFYNFDHTLIRDDFKYRGPTFRWPTMTDQYVLHYINETFVKESEKPLFIEYMLISSHYPFQLIPVYEPDWNKLNRGRIYRNSEYVISMPVPKGKNTAGPEGLTQGLLYTMQSVTEYLMKLENENFLAIITGDHQPVKRVTGPWGDKNVVFHVLSKNRELVEPFLQNGFTSGYYKEKEPVPPRMDEIMPLILNQLSSVPPLPPRISLRRKAEENL